MSKIRFSIVKYTLMYISMLSLSLCFFSIKSLAFEDKIIVEFSNPLYDFDETNSLNTYDSKAANFGTSSEIIDEIDSSESEIEKSEWKVDLYNDVYLNEDTRVFNDFASASKFLRSNMVNRKDDIDVYLSKAMFNIENLTDDEIKGYIVDLFYSTFNYDDSCTGLEGDALSLVWEKIGASIDYLFEEGIYVIKYHIEYYTNYAQEQELTIRINSIVDELGLKQMEDCDKAVAIHDYICDNVDFDYDNLNKDDYKIKYTAYGALINGKAVCQGYAVLFYRLCKEAGLSVRVITGTSRGVNHAWNIVKVGDYYYNVDTTWDGQTENTYRTWSLLGELDFVDHTRDADLETSDFRNKFTVDKNSYVYKDKILLKGYYMDISSTYELNFYFYISDILSNDLFDGRFDISVGDEKYVEVIDIKKVKTSVDGIVGMDTTNGAFYMVSVPVYPAYINENINLTYTYGAYKKNFNYSLGEYLENLLDEEIYGQSTMLLARDLIKYSLSVIEYFDYKEKNSYKKRIDMQSISEYSDVSDSIDKNLDSLISDSKDYSLCKINDISSKIDFYGASIICKDRVGLKLYFTLNNQGTTSTSYLDKCSIQCNDAMGKGLQYNLISNESYFCIDIKDMNYLSLGSMTKLLIQNSNENENISVDYSPLTYIEKVINSNCNSELVSLCRNLFVVYSRLCSLA